jgi:hypothetical protein
LSERTAKPTGKDHKGAGRKPPNETGSGYGFRFMRKRVQKVGGTFYAAKKAILKDQGKAGEWARRSDERQLQRVWEAADDPAYQVSDEPESITEYQWVSAITPRRKEWVWRGHLLRGGQELLSGIPGMAKSQIQCSWIGNVTTGRDWPDRCLGCDKGSVIMVTAEDCLEDTVIPRLMAVEADLSKISILRAIKQDDKHRMFLLGEDLEELERKIKEMGDVALVCLDPITAFMGRINNSGVIITTVRGQLGPLKELAERTHVAFSTITHSAKDAGQRAIDHFIGSQAHIAAGRIGHLCVAEMGTDADGKMVPTGRFLLTNPKNNAGPKMPTLAYRVEECIVGKRPNVIDDITRVAWEEVVELSSDAAVAASKGNQRTTPVDDFLRELLGRGSMWKKDIDAEAAKAGYSADQLRGAKHRLNIQSKKVGLQGNKWSLPKAGGARP